MNKPGRKRFQPGFFLPRGYAVPMRNHRNPPSANMTFGKRPRQYAAEIIALPMRAQRQRALAEVPDEVRDWVREYVEDYFAKRKFF